MWQVSAASWAHLPLLAIEWQAGRAKQTDPHRKHARAQVGELEFPLATRLSCLVCDWNKCAQLGFRWRRRHVRKCRALLWIQTIVGLRTMLLLGRIRAPAIGCFALLARRWPVTQVHIAKITAISSGNSIAPSPLVSTWKSEERMT